MQRSHRASTTLMEEELGHNSPAPRAQLEASHSQEPTDIFMESDR